MVRGAVADRHDHHHRGDDRHLLSVAREREQGTLDQLLVSPLATWQIFVGKAVPALIVATFQATIVLGVGIWAYQIPFAGSLAAVLLHDGDLRSVAGGVWSADFGAVLHAAAGVYRRVRLYDAGDFALGYVSPVENMPVWLQDLTWINPIRHFTDITKQIYLKDASLEIVWGSLWPLLVIAATTGSVAYAMFRRNIA
jgi:ABC-2 type transport system permease protein